MKIKVCVSGATGAVGKALVEAIIESDDLELVGATSRTNAGKNLGKLIGRDNCNLIISGTLEEALKAPTDVVVDYTNATAVKQNVLLHWMPVCRSLSAALVLQTMIMWK